MRGICTKKNITVSYITAKKSRFPLNLANGRQAVIYNYTVTYLLVLMAKITI